MVWDQAQGACFRLDLPEAHEQEGLCSVLTSERCMQGSTTLREGWLCDQEAVH